MLAAMARHRPTSSTTRDPSRPLSTEQVRVEKLAAGGDGIAHLADGRIVFVEGALPDELVRVAVHTSKRDFARGSVIDVLEASPNRQSPPCPEVERGCGGCGWQYATAESQLQWKADIVSDALRRTARSLVDPNDFSH